MGLRTEERIRCPPPPPPSPPVHEASRCRGKSIGTRPRSFCEGGRRHRHRWRRSACTSWSRRRARDMARHPATRMREVRSEPPHGLGCSPAGGGAEGGRDGRERNDPRDKCSQALRRTRERQRRRPVVRRWNRCLDEGSGAVISRRRQAVSHFRPSVLQRVLEAIAMFDAHMIDFRFTATHFLDRKCAVCIGYASDRVGGPSLAMIAPKNRCGAGWRPTQGP